MADIFISYSSKDREKAEQLTELLASAGLSVWIDQSALDVSTSWSAEIVDAITGCKAFIVLLSPNSIESHNVIKEVSLASEKRKKILPLDLEPVPLPRELEYQLAGIHRAPMTNIDAIIRAIGKLGLEATQAPTLKLVKETDSRKSLMILPFEDLSPTQDNGWFTDGIASELISVLSNVRSLKLIDWNTSRMLKNKSIKTVELAREFSVRYFIEGQVRKFGDNIKISITLLDIETGDHLWQDSLKGTMEDIFDIQEQVAKKVTEGLSLHLTNDEKAKLAVKPTENAEAYELLMKAEQYFMRHTKSDLERTVALYEDAVRLDPEFTVAYARIANTYTALYRTYTKTTLLLDKAVAAVEKVRELEGETTQYCWAMSSIALCRGDAESAVGFAKRSVELDPLYAPGYDALGFAYQVLGMKEEAIRAREEDVRLRGNSITAHFSLLVALNDLGNISEVRERLQSAAVRAIPIFERHIRLNPDDYIARVNLANVFSMAGRIAEALREAEKLSAIETLDGFALYNLTCLYTDCHEPERAMAMLRCSIEKGYKNIERLRRDPDLATLRGTPEFEALMKELEEKIAKEKKV